MKKLIILFLIILSINCYAQQEQYEINLIISKLDWDIANIREKKLPKFEKFVDLKIDSKTINNIKKKILESDSIYSYYWNGLEPSYKKIKNIDLITDPKNIDCKECYDSIPKLQLSIDISYNYLTNKLSIIPLGYYLSYINLEYPSLLFPQYFYPIINCKENILNKENPCSSLNDLGVKEYDYYYNITINLESKIIENFDLFKSVNTPLVELINNHYKADSAYNNKGEKVLIENIKTSDSETKNSWINSDTTLTDKTDRLYYVNIKMFKNKFKYSEIYPISTRHNQYYKLINNKSVLDKTIDEIDFLKW